MMNEQACINMIKQQLRTGDVLDERILNLYERVKRSVFVPAEMRQFAYSDMQIPLAHDQRMMTPTEEGRLLQALQLKGTETVLEIGTGTGFLTALLSKLSKKVISVDYFKYFTEAAAHKLEQFHCNNVELITGDGHNGWLEKAPYEVVVFSGAVEKLTKTHLLQVMPGGKLIAVVGKAPVAECKLLTLDHQENWVEKTLFDTSLPPLIHSLTAEEFIF